MVRKRKKKKYHIIIVNTSIYWYSIKIYEE
jgi:hypothetical protein